MGDQIEELYEQLKELLGELGADAEMAFDELAGAQKEACGEELGAVVDAIRLTYAAAGEIEAALKRYKRAVAPMAEPKRGSSRMFK
jgi:hypothetical protein